MQRDDSMQQCDTLSCVRLSRSSLGVMQTYLTSMAAAYGSTSKMEYVYLCAIRSLVAIFPHVESPADNSELSLLLILFNLVERH